MENRKALLNGVLVLVIIIAVGVFVYRLMTLGPESEPPPPPREPVPVWFYDLGTGELFEGTSDQVPPIDAPSGPDQGVRAFVIEYADQPGEKQVVYLWKFEGEAHEAQTIYKRATEAGELTPEVEKYFMSARQGQYVTKPEPIDWINVGDQGRPEYMGELRAAASQRGAYQRVTPR